MTLYCAVWTFFKHREWYTVTVPSSHHLGQDLDIIEAALTDLETIKHREFGGDYLVYQMTTLLKAWAHVAGMPRPAKEPPMRKAVSSRKLRPPMRVNGETPHHYTLHWLYACIIVLCIMYCIYWCVVRWGVVECSSSGGVSALGRLYDNGEPNDSICSISPLCYFIGTALRYGSWDFSERALLAEYKVNRWDY